MIIIQPLETLADIQQEFTAAFPYLKLEFFKHRHKAYAGSPKKDLLEPDEVIKMAVKASENIAIDEEMTVDMLEKLFLEKCGIAMQVFRKSGKLWLETSQTDDWTLKRQNDQGRELSYLNK